MNNTEVREKKSFTVREETVIIRPIARLRNKLVDSLEHEAAFLYKNADNRFCLPIDTQGNLVNPFSSKEEQEWLEDRLDLDLNPYKIEKNYWHKHRVVLDKRPLNLKLSNPKHYLDYLILKTNKQVIAPSLEEQFNKATYRYVMSNAGSELKEVVKKADLEIEAYMALGKLRDSKEDMLNFLRIYGKKVSKDSKIEFLVNELKKIIEQDLETFLNIIRDKDNYEMKLFIADCTDAGIINSRGKQYFLPGGDSLCGEGSVSVLSEAIKYLKNPANEELYLNLKTRLENAKD